MREIRKNLFKFALRSAMSVPFLDHCIYHIIIKI
jgi:hypothetical protein